MTGQPLVLTWENVRFLRVISSWFLRRDRLRVVSLFSWSVEQNARDTQITTRVSERRFATRRSRARSLPLTKSEKKKNRSQSNDVTNGARNALDTEYGKTCDSVILVL